MRSLLFNVLLLLLFLFIQRNIFAADWFYPTTEYQKRIQYKDFGTNVNDEFYKGKEGLFPTRFKGYHAAVDLEVFPFEKDINVPVYAVADGVITYAGVLDGYGGVVLEKLDGTGHTALYGHVRIADMSYKVGDPIKAGSVLTYLGKGFSTETSGERKHLHFGIHKGVDLYFHGHEASEKILLNEWENPTSYLKLQGAKDLGSTITPTSVKATPGVIHTQQVPEKAPWIRLLEIFLNFIKSISPQKQDM